MVLALLVGESEAQRRIVTCLRSIRSGPCPLTSRCPLVPKGSWAPLCTGPCAQCWEEPGLGEGFPQRVVSRTNAAGCAAIERGFVGQEIEGP